MRKSSQTAKKSTKASMPKKSIEMGLGCAWCMFRTPALGLDGYPAMTRNLQRHAEEDHGVKVPGGKDVCTCQMPKAGKEQRSSTSRSASSRSRERSQSQRGRFNVEELDFACPDCNLHSFATETGLYMHRKKSCGLRGVKSTSLDFSCQGEGCDRAFTSPLGLATHRRSCKKSPGPMGAQEKVVRRGREEVRGQPKEKRRKVVGEEGGGGRSRSLTSGAREARAQLGERESEGDGKNRSRTAGATSARSKGRGVAATSRSVTSDQGVSSTSKGGGRRTEASDIQMEMEIDMKLKDGRCATTKYRVGCLTTMQSVVKRVAAKMEQEVHKVRLYRGPTLVPGASLAVNYGGCRLTAKVLGMV